MKILLSAYACEPHKGSEPGMGWHWAIEIARLGHEVHILTRSNNLEALRKELAPLDSLRIELHGYDLPQWIRRWKKGGRGIHLYYLLWQWFAYRSARQLHARQRFDMVHHITFAVYRHPSFMGRIGIPFVVGPLGGGEYAPVALLRTAPPRAKIMESLRWMSNRLALVDPSVRGMFKQASLILYKTPETFGVIPPSARRKSMQVADVAADSARIAGSIALGSERPTFLFVGNLLHLKGIHLALAALCRVRKDLPDATLTIAGDGRDKEWLQAQARQLDIERAVVWRGRLSHDEVFGLYACHTAFVFPSLHDSGGTVVMEALSQGLPVICLDMGGPGAMLPDDCGFKIEARTRSEDRVVCHLAEAMMRLASDDSLRRQLAANALDAARSHSWGALVRSAYAQIEARLNI